MPVVRITVTPPTTRDQRAAIVADVTASLTRHLGKKPEHTHVVFEEIAEENWGFAGVLTDDYRRVPESASE
ncbi:MAG: 4-oxalocrotonate tautomerase family protein [Planctomycetota bacterium]